MCRFSYNFCQRARALETDMARQFWVSHPFPNRWSGTCSFFPVRVSVGSSGEGSTSDFDKSPDAFVLL